MTTSVYPSLDDAIRQTAHTQLGKFALVSVGRVPAVIATPCDLPPESKTPASSGSPKAEHSASPRTTAGAAPFTWSTLKSVARGISSAASGLPPVLSNVLGIGPPGCRHHAVQTALVIAGARCHLHTSTATGGVNGLTYIAVCITHGSLQLLSMPHP